MATKSEALLRRALAYLSNTPDLVQEGAEDLAREISGLISAGADSSDRPAVSLASPVYQIRYKPYEGSPWRDIDEKGYAAAAGDSSYERRVLFAVADAQEVERLGIDLALTQLARQGDAIEIEGLKVLNDRLRARMAELEAALAPFAAPELIEQLDGSPEHGVPRTDNDDWAKFRLLAGDYRRAAKALVKPDAQ